LAGARGAPGLSAQRGPPGLQGPRGVRGPIGTPGKSLNDFVNCFQM